jgi:2'-5' RNA ligase
MAEAEKLRLFVAFDVPEPFREALQEIVEPLRDALTGARWTNVADQHVTLRFLGWVPAEARSDVDAVCREVAGRREPADLSLGDLGTFPSTRRARVLWAGIEDLTGLTPGLAADLDAGFRTLGFEPEQRSYTPHLTLARIKRPRPLGDLPQVPSEARGIFRLEEVVLYRSHLSPKGARYELVERFPLGSSGE